MKDYATVANILGTFPSVSAKNCSGAGATDGTALVADWVNNLWGWVQDAISRAGLTPSGVVEAYAAETGSLPLGTTATQIRTALQMAHGSPGELVLWCRSQAPSVVGARVLLLQGQTIAIASYKDLVAATYCGDGVNNTALVPFYKSSDSGGVTRSTSGTYFTLPDARGVTIRGVDTGATKDPQGATRGGGTPNGSLQGYLTKNHVHMTYQGSNSDGAAGTLFSSTGALHDPTGINAGATNKQRFIIGGLTNAVNWHNTDFYCRSHEDLSDTSETRMYNLACFIGIRY